MNRRLAATAFALLLLGTSVPARAAPSTDFGKMPAGTYVFDPDHASLIARVNHQGFSRFTMRFRVADAQYVWDPASPETSKVSATVDTASFDTGLPGKDPGLAKAFLEADRFPTATFVSTAIAPAEDGKGVMIGDLTLNGVTRPVTFDVTWNGYASGVFGQRSGFSAQATLHRSEFGLDHFLKPPLAFVGDEVELVIEIEFVKK